MVSKHRRSDDGPVQAPLQTPLSTAEFWSEEVWGPPPALHPDHPSASMPRVRVQTDRTGPVDTGSQPAVSGRGRHTVQHQPVSPAASDRQRTAAVLQRTGRTLPQRGTGPQHAVSTGHQRAARAYQGPENDGSAAPRAAAQPLGFAAPPGYAARGYASQAYSEPRGYRVARGRLYAVRAEPAADYQAGPARSERPAHGPWYDAASIREAAEEEAAAIRQRAADDAAALTRQASEEAAKIREAAERVAVELRAALLAMQGELGRVATYVTESLTAPAIPAAPPMEAPVTQPVWPASRRPAGPATRPHRPAANPAEPDTKPARPGTRPGAGSTAGEAKRTAEYCWQAG